MGCPALLVIRFSAKPPAWQEPRAARHVEQNPQAGRARAAEGLKAGGAERGTIKNTSPMEASSLTPGEVWVTP